MDVITMAAWALGFIAVAMAIGYFLMVRSYPYRIRVREWTSTNVELIHDKLAKIAIDEDKIEHLRLFGSIGQIKRLPLPPAEAKSYDPKKKKIIVEADYSEEDGITYLSRKPDDRAKGFQPFKTAQRQMMVNQIYKKEARKIKNPWMQNLPLIINLAAIVMLVAVVLLFWGEAIAPIQAAAQTSVTAIDKADKLYARIDAVLEDKQLVFEDETAGGG